VTQRGAPLRLPSGVSAVPGDYSPVGGTLPFTLNYTLADTHSVVPSGAALYVYDLSAGRPRNDPIAQVGGATAVACALGPHAGAVELPALDGSPYYMVICAKDGYGDETLMVGPPPLRPLGDRDHKDRVVSCRGVRLETVVHRVYPLNDGRVWLSDALGTIWGSTPALAGDGAHCQSQGGQARVQATTRLSSVDVIEGNNGTTMNRPCGGVTVHFTTVDPDSRTLWDATPDDTGSDNSSPTPPTLTQAAVVSVPATVTQGGNPVTLALAQTDLVFAGSWSGDNHAVRASVYSTTVTGVEPVESGTLEVWKLIYYERDRMHAAGSRLEAAVAATDTVLEVEDGGQFQDHDLVVIFDAQHHHPVATPPATPDTVTVEVTQVVGNDLHLAAQVGAAFQDWEGGGAVGVAQRGTGAYEPYVDAIRTRLVAPAFDADAFVQFAADPRQLEGDCLFPQMDWIGWFAWHNDYFDHQAGNVVHFIDGWEDSAGDRGSHSTLNTRQLVVFASESATVEGLEETLVHECGHVFGFLDRNAEHPNGHPPHQNVDGSEDCVMLYSSDFTNGIALFGGRVAPPPDPDPASDLIVIAGHADPL
jgi:hypothetical protein